MMPNWFFWSFATFFWSNHFLIRCQTKVLLWRNHVSLGSKWKNPCSGFPSLMAADKPCPQLQPSLVSPTLMTLLCRGAWALAREKCKMGRAIHPFFSFRPIGSSASWYLFRRTRKSFSFKRHKKPFTQMVLVMLQGKLLHGNLMQSYENYTSLNVTVRDIEFIEDLKCVSSLQIPAQHYHFYFIYHF